MKMKLYALVIVIIAAILTSCLSPNIIKNTLGSNEQVKGISFEEFERRQKNKIKEMLKNKTSYTEDIKLSINPGLLNKSSSSNVFKVEFSQENSFDIKTVPQGAIVYQKIFTLDKGNLETIEDFKVNDISKRYTLYLKTDREKAHGTIDVNAFRWINDSDFNKRTEEIIKDSVLLNINNKISIKLEGQKNSKVTVMIIEGGQAGTIKSQNSSDVDKHDTNEKHLKAGDINIFNGTIESLGKLEAYSGDVSMPENGITISSLLVNGKNQIKFESGVLIVKFDSPDGLTLFQSLYGAEVLGELDGSYRLKINLDKSPINKISNLLKELNKGISVEIQSIDFSSVNSLKTFVIALDFLINHPDKAGFVDANVIMEIDSAPVHFLDSQDNQTPPSWGLTKANVFEAWNYSIGTNVTASVIDRGFNKEHPEIKRRIKMDMENNQILCPNLLLCPDRNDIRGLGTQSDMEHGHICVMAGFAERNNGIKSAGVSPNSNAIPYSMFTTWDEASAIKKAVDHGAKVISISVSSPYDEWNNPFLKTIEKVVGFLSGAGTLDEQIKRAVEGNNSQNRKIPIIISAGNWGQHVSTRVPAFLDPVEGVVVTGGAKVQVSSNDLYVVFNPTYSYDTNGKGTGFGENVVWGPWGGLQVSSYNKDPKTNNYELIDFGGNSSSAPFVAGITSLMLSRNPSLTAQEIEDILHRTSSEPVYISNHTDMLTYPGGNFLTIRTFVNAKLAVEEAIKLNYPSSTNLSTFEAKEFPVAYFDGTNLKFIDGSTLKYLPTLSNEQKTHLTGKLIKPKGWDNSIFSKTINSGEIEILDATEFTLQPSVTSINLSDLNGNTSSDIVEDGFIEINGSNLYGIMKHENLVLINRNSKIEYSLYDLPVSKNDQATYVKFRFKKSSLKREGGINSLIPIGTTEIYDLKFSGDNGESPLFSGTSGFIISSIGSGTTPPHSVTFTFSVKSEIVQPEQFIDDKISSFPLKVFPGDTVAAALNRFLTNTNVYINGQSVPMKSIVDNYIAFKVPPDIPEGFQSVIIRTAGGDVTYPEALEILAKVSAGENPGYPVTFNDGQIVAIDHFIDNNPNTPPLQVKSGDTVGVSLTGNVNLANVDIYVGDKIVTMKSIVDNYIAFKVPPDVPEGTQNVFIQYAGGNVTFEQALKILGNVLPPGNWRAFYNFNENANDVTGNGYNGTLLNGASINGTLNITQNSGGNLNLPASLLSGLTDFTVSANAKIDSFYYFDTWDLGPASMSINTFLWTRNLNYYYPDIFIMKYKKLAGSPGYWEIEYRYSVLIFSDSTMDDNNFHKIKISKQGHSISMEIDGRSLGSQAGTSGGAVNYDFIRIGQNINRNNYNPVSGLGWLGKIDDLGFSTP